MSLRDDIVRRAQGVFGARLRGILVFGSRVSGRARVDSDLDLLVWLEGPLRRRDTWLPWIEVFADVDPVLDPTFVTDASLASPSSWLLEAVHAGVEVWFDPTGRLEGSLAEIRAAIAAGTYRRRVFMGLPYYAKEAS